jgi:hypothetical protein
MFVAIVDVFFIEMRPERNTEGAFIVRESVNMKRRETSLKRESKGCVLDAGWYFLFGRQN